MAVSEMQCFVYLLMHFWHPFLSDTADFFLNAYSSYLSSALYNNKQMEGKRAHSAFHSHYTRPEIITELQRLTAALNQHAIATSSLSPIHVHTHLHTHHPWRQGHATKSLYFLVSARKAQQTQTTESVSL